MRRRLVGIAPVLVALALAVAAPALAQAPVPGLTGRVNDTAGLLSAERAARLERSLAGFEAETSHQIVVLTVPTLAGEDIETYAMRVAESWKIGHEGLDNGVIVIVAQQDRRARIEVGYGLEGTIPDAIAARILREHMIPHFRAGEMDAGIEAGVDALMAAARGEEIPLEQRPFRGGSAVAPDDLPRLLFAVFLGAGIGGVFRRTRTLRVAASAGVAGLLGLFLLEAIPWAGLAALLGGALGLFAPIGPLSGGRRTGGGGWVGGSSGGFGGGGFSGGGGSFGGGGASGSW